MERHRDQDLERIRQSLLRMGGLVERMTSEAMAALVERDTSRAQAVIRTDSEVDQLEKDLDDACHARPRAAAADGGRSAVSGLGDEDRDRPRAHG